VRLRSWAQLALVAALLLSIMANVFLLGFSAHGIGSAREAGGFAESIGAAYSPEVRAEFRKLLREDRARTLATLRDLREARRSLATAANAAMLNEAEVRHAMEKVRQQTGALQQLMQEHLLEALKRTRGAG